MTEDERNAARYENDLIHQRLTWLGTFEGLLFVANSYEKHPYLLPIAGFLIALSIDFGIRASNRELDNLKAQAYRDWRAGVMPGVLVPKLVLATWVCIFLWNFGWVRDFWTCLRGT